MKTERPSLVSRERKGETRVQRCSKHLGAYLIMSRQTRGKGGPIDAFGKTATFMPICGEGQEASSTKVELVTVAKPVNKLAVFECWL